MRHRSLPAISLILLSALVFSPFPASAQLPTATLSGIVTDAQGALLPDARVTLTSKATGATRSGNTSADGSFLFANLPAGLYDVRVEASGFGTQEHKDVRLEVGRSLTLDVSLEIAPMEQVVTVTGGGTAIELTQSQVQGQITSTTVENIPLNGRNFLELAYLVPGNRPGQNYDPTKTNTLQVSSAGQMGRGGNHTVDGGDNNDEVVGGTLMNFPQDSVQEFQIATNRYTAEVGRSASSIINIITKSGANEYHGSAFLFFRHDNLQGRPATDDRTRPEAPFERYQYGGSIGGPIQTDKAWWFLSVENRDQDAAIQVGERDFASQSVTTTSASAPLDDFMILGRIDLKVSEKDDMFGRYAFNRSEEVAAGSSIGVPLGSAANRQSSLNRFQSILYNWTRAISPTQINSFTFHVNTFINQIPAFGENVPLTNPSGLGIGPEGPAEVVFATLQDGANFRIPQQTRMPRWQARNTFSWARGKHSLRFGGEWQRAGSDILFDIFGSGSVFLPVDFWPSDCVAQGIDLNNDGSCDDRDIPILFVLQSAAPVRPPTAPRNWSSYLGFFIQDDWRVRPNFTLNLGLRWDFDTDVFGEGRLHDPCPEPLDVQPSEPCLWIKTALGLKRDRGYSNFSPRLGFAWDPFSRGKTVIRGGYGIYYDRVTLEVKILEQFVNGRTIAIGALGGSTCNIAGVAADCFDPGARFDPGTPTLANPFAGAQEAGGIGIDILNNDIAHPMVQQWTLGIQQEIASNWTIAVDGIHNFGTRFIIARPVRAFNFPDTAPTPGPCPAAPPLPLLCFDDSLFLLATDPLTGRTDGILEFPSDAKMWYDGLLVSFKKRPTRHGDWGYGFDVNYTLSKTLNYGNDDQIDFQTFGQADIVLGMNNFRLEKGLAPNDERHRLVFFGVFELPYDFAISPIWTLTSNVPINAFVPGLSARLPILARNALGGDIKTGAELNSVINQWNNLGPCLDTDPLPRTSPCRVGSALAPVDPNLRFGDGFNALDLRVTKAFVIGERHRIEAIGEVFNLFNITNIRGFNRANFSGFNNNITSPEFNRPVRTAGGFFGSGGPRAFQLAVRYSF